MNMKEPTKKIEIDRLDKWRVVLKKTLETTENPGTRKNINIVLSELDHLFKRGRPPLLPVSMEPLSNALRFA